MNRIYRLVWCQSLGAMVVASELASSKHRTGTTSTRKPARPSAWLSTLLVGGGSLLLALPAFAQSTGNAKLDDLQSVMARYSTPATMVQASAHAQAATEVMAATPASAVNVRMHAATTPRATQSVAAVKSPVPAAPSALNRPAPVTHAAMAAPSIPLDTATASPRMAAASVQPVAVTPAASVAQVSASTVHHPRQVAPPGVSVAEPEHVSSVAAVATAARPTPASVGEPVASTLDAIPVSAMHHPQQVSPPVYSPVSADMPQQVSPVAVATTVRGTDLPSAAVAMPAARIPSSGELLTVSVHDTDTTPATGAAIEPALSMPAQAIELASIDTATAETDTSALPPIAADRRRDYSLRGASLNALPQKDDDALAGDTVAQTTNQPLAAVSSAEPITLASTGNLLPTSSRAVSDSLFSTNAVTPMAAPVVPAPGPDPTGLVIGNGGVVGVVTDLLGTTENGLFNNSGTDGYVKNGSLRISNANFTQGYSTLNLLGIPLVNATPVGSLLTSTGGDVVGGTGINSHLTLIGGVTSGNYISNINNGAAGGLLGLLLPDQAPNWASTCLNVLGVLTEKCWGVNAAQDYQVLMGDGASANGSKEVVIGTNAKHTLPTVDASDAFPGAGTNDANNPTGVPTADYAARLGHSVVIGDDASGTANAQTILGAEATASVANSVALGYKSDASRGAQAGYTAFGLTAAQDSAGEVSVGAAGQERQITNVAAGSADTDAVNVSQLEGALVDATEGAVMYDGSSAAPDLTHVTLAGPASTDGGVTGGTTISNVHQGELSETSTDAVNGAQLYATNQDVDSIGKLAVKYDADSNGDPTNQVSLIGDGTGAPVGLGNLAAGEVSDSSTDAVNGSQLFATNDAITNYLGGTTNFDPSTGTWTAPTFSITSIAGDGSSTQGDYDNVTDAFAAVDSSVVNVNNRITDIDNGGGIKYFHANSAAADSTATGLESVAIGPEAESQSDGSVALGAGAVADRDGMAGATELFSDTAVASTAGAVSVGADGAERQITNVAGGTEDTDAVNVRQLTAVDDQVQDVSKLAVKYDADGNGDPTNQVSLTGDGTGAPVGITNLAAGELSETSTDAVNGAQLYATNQDVDSIGKLAVKYDADSNGDPTNQITLVGDGTGAPVGIGNVAAGEVSDSSTDAVNGSQLFATNDAITNYFGGTTNFDPSTGTWTAPTFSITSISGDGSSTQGDYDNVTDAFAAVDSSVVNVNNRITDIDNGGGIKYFHANSAGTDSLATGTDSVAIGPEAESQSDGSVALGAGAVAARAGMAGATELFSGAAVASTMGAVSVGSDGAERQITNVAGGTEDTDAVNVRQLTAVDDKITSIGNLTVKYDADSNGDPTNQITLTGDGTGAPVTISNVAPGEVSNSSTDAVNGSQLFATNDTITNYFGGTTNFDPSTGTWTAPTFSITSIAGDGSTTEGDYDNVTDAFSAMNNSVVNVNNRITDIDNGGGIKYFHANSTGADSVASGAESIAVGPTAIASGDGSVAMGSGAAASADNSVAIGAGSVASTGAETGYDGAYMDPGSSNSAGEVSVGATGAERKITNVADGSDAHDAANIGQLEAGVNHAISVSNEYTDQQINNVAKNTSFQVNDTQSLGKPTASGDNSAAGGAGAAATGKDSTALGNGSTAKGSNSVALGAGSVADRDNTVSVGSDGHDRQISHVAAGTDASDAVNVKQLQASTQGTVHYDHDSNGNTDYGSVTLGSTAGPTTIHNVGAGTADTDAANVGQVKEAMNWANSYTDRRVESLSNRANAGVASAMAMAGLPQAYSPGKSMAAIAAGSFRGESSLAIGISTISEGGRWVYKLTGSTDTRGDAGVTIGAGMQW